MEAKLPARTNVFQKVILLAKRHSAPESTVTESAMLLDRHTGAEREVDICIRTTIADHSVVISIECTDTSRPADVGWIDRMKAKHERLPTNSLVLVSRSGFSEEALKVARLNGIEALALEAVRRPPFVSSTRL